MKQYKSFLPEITRKLLIMNRHPRLICLFFTCCFLAACTTKLTYSPDEWVTLFDGTDLSQWNTTGDANWHLAGNTVSADTGSGMLVSKRSYRDFELRLEFWVDHESNSGVFIRCDNPTEISPTSCYEVNIFDSRPDQSGRTGAIVDVAPPRVKIDSEGKWNTYEITARGSRLIVRLNEVVTVDAEDSRLSQGPFALQFGSGGVRFRNVVIREL